MTESSSDRNLGQAPGCSREPVGLPPAVEELESHSSFSNEPGTCISWVPRLRLVWEHRRSILRICAAGFAVSVAAALLLPKWYRSTTRLMPPDSQSASSTMVLAGLAGKAGSGLGAMAGDLLGLKNSGALFVEMLQSQTIQEHLVGQFGLEKVYGEKLLGDARKELDQNTSIQEDRKSGVIAITVTDRSPQRAAAIANAYVDELNSMVSQLSTSSAHRERVFLEGRLQGVKQDLNDAETQLAQFSSNNNTLDIQQQGKAMLDAAATLAGQMIAAQSELEGLRQIYTDSNARVRALNARVAELRKELDKLRGMDTYAVSNTARAADPPANPSGDPVAKTVVDMRYPSIRNLPLLGAKYADYYRRAKIQETIFEVLTEQSELAKVDEAKETPSVTVLDPADIPEHKSYPARLMIIVLGTLIAFAMSVIRILGTARWQEMDPQDERKILLQEVVEATKAQMFWGSQYGSGLRFGAQRILGRLRPSRTGPPE